VEDAHRLAGCAQISTVQGPSGRVRSGNSWRLAAVPELPKRIPFEPGIQETAFLGAWKGQRPRVRVMQMAVAQSPVRAFPVRSLFKPNRCLCVGGLPCALAARRSRARILP
jgi:hypothetical protein